MHIYLSVLHVCNLPGVNKQVYSPVVLVSRGLSGYDVFVDRLSTITAVLVIPDHVASHSSDHEKSVFIFTVPDTDIQSLLNTSGLLKHDHITFNVVWKETYDKVRDILSQRGVSPYTEVLSSGSDVYYTENVPDVPTLPDGFSTRSLVPTDYELIISGVEYRNANYVKSVKRILAVGTVSVGVEEVKSGELVAWSLQQIYGYLGMTFVRPEFRNKGLGKYVTASLARQMIDNNGFCMAAIGGLNSISINMHIKLGFKQMNRLFYSGLFRAKQSTSYATAAIMSCS
ncbi:uncharacterized protein LOC117336395 isoform X2 [Pecten maximus]|uniref:uncharacterized protein LOC117336395 isoform X2 n=1 Tax=Pecten maximus TaxID=6579 RepID=UPI001458FFBE|nr:uncharacterized protein LOC117336395 isoform X2 [Pecten maximus]